MLLPYFLAFQIRSNRGFEMLSGPIIIGQAAEFDYSGTQACQALKEEGIEVVLVNSNPATIMTDKEVADKIYIISYYITNYYWLVYLSHYFSECISIFTFFYRLY